MFLQKLFARFLEKKIVRCGRCLWWEQTAVTIGQCHRRPPSTWHFGDCSSAEFPLTSVLCFCGEAVQVQAEELARRKKVIEDANKVTNKNEK